MSTEPDIFNSCHNSIKDLSAISGTDSDLDRITSALNRSSLITTHDETHPFEAVVPPIVQTSLFTFSSYGDAEKVYRGDKEHWFYTRYSNPTLRQFEEMVAKLEGAEDALGLFILWQ